MPRDKFVIKKQKRLREAFLRFRRYAVSIRTARVLHHLVSLCESHFTGKRPLSCHQLGPC